MRLLRGFGRFWFDFLVGDDWRIAAGVTGVLAAGAVLVAADLISHPLLPPLVAIAIAGVVSASLART